MADAWNDGLIPPTPLQPQDTIKEPDVKPEVVPETIRVSTNPISEVIEDAVEVQTTHKYRTVRASGDNVYLIVEGKKHWILNPQVLEKLGFKMGDEDKIEPAELATYLPGETITMANAERYV